MTESPFLFFSLEQFLRMCFILFPHMVPYFPLALLGLRESRFFAKLPPNNYHYIDVIIVFILLITVTLFMSDI